MVSIQGLVCMTVNIVNVDYFRYTYTVLVGFLCGFALLDRKKLVGDRMCRRVLYFPNSYVIVYPIIQKMILMYVFVLFRFFFQSFLEYTVENVFDVLTDLGA